MKCGQIAHSTWMEVRHGCGHRRFPGRFDAPPGAGILRLALPLSASRPQGFELPAAVQRSITALGGDAPSEIIDGCLPGIVAA